MKRIVLAMIMVMVAMGISAQRTISGKITDDNSGEEMIGATVKLLKKDSTQVKGVTTDMNGNFKLTAPANGQYVLKVSSVGYKTLTKSVTVKNGANVTLGSMGLTPDAIMLKGVVATGQAKKVTVKEDTFMYNASAYRTPEGSVVEELVKRLPGAQVSDDGTITMNGKTVKKILVDGKEFMVGDTKTALKNLPTSIIEKVKSYDQKSDLARVSGIDDGEEETVLDFGIKKGMNKGFFGNADLAAGTSDRYASRAMAATFNDKLKVMGFGSANNVNDMGFPGGGGRWGGRSNGLNASKMLGVNVNYEKKDKLILNGSVRWNHSDGDVFSRTSTENFLSTTGSFSNRTGQNFSRSNSWNGQMRLEWMPDTMTNILFRPSFSISTSDGLNTSRSATFNDDPYKYVSDPLNDIDDIDKENKVNLTNNRSLSYSDSKNFGAMLQFNRKLNNMGRNLTLRVNAQYSENGSNSLTNNDATLFQKVMLDPITGQPILDPVTGLPMDSTYQTNRYNVTPSKNYNYRARVTYSEPIMKATFLQFSYQFQYKYTKSDRSTYDFSNEMLFDGMTPRYRGWDDYLNKLPNPIESYLDENLSKFSQYKNYIHDMEVQLRIIRKAYNLNVGVKFQPQTTDFKYKYQGVDTVVKRNVFNVTPTADFRWKFSKVSQFRFQYNGTTSQPSMTDLLEVYDDSNPLDITTGNSGLKPSFTQNFRLFYNNYFQKRQQAVMAHIDFSTTRNSISNCVTYDPVTGGSFSRPENINGNWNVSGAFMFNTSIDTTGYFNVNTFTTLRYNHYVGFINLNKSAVADKNVTQSSTIGERLAASYRNSWLEFELNGSLNYTHSTNDLQAQSNLDTWDFSYGASANVQMPWNMMLATNIDMNSRRGYSDASMNTNELIWNAQLSQSLLKGNALTLSLQFYDILKQKSNFSRMIDAYRRTDTEYNSVNSYAMLHVIYRLNLFGGKQARMDSRGGRGERMGTPGGFGGRRGFGGGGFGRPGRF